MTGFVARGLLFRQIMWVAIRQHCICCISFAYLLFIDVTVVIGGSSLLFTIQGVPRKNERFLFDDTCSLVKERGPP